MRIEIYEFQDVVVGKQIPDALACAKRYEFELFPLEETIITTPVLKDAFYSVKRDGNTVLLRRTPALFGYSHIEPVPQERVLLDNMSNERLQIGQQTVLIAEQFVEDPNNTEGRMFCGMLRVVGNSTRREHVGDPIGMKWHLMRLA